MASARGNLRVRNRPRSLSSVGCTNANGASFKSRRYTSMRLFEPFEALVGAGCRRWISHGNRRIGHRILLNDLRDALRQALLNVELVARVLVSEIGVEWAGTHEAESALIGSRKLRVAVRLSDLRVRSDELLALLATRVLDRVVIDAGPRGRSSAPGVVGQRGVADIRSGDRAPTVGAAVENAITLGDFGRLATATSGSTNLPGLLGVPLRIARNRASTAGREDTDVDLVGLEANPCARKIVSCAREQGGTPISAQRRR